MTDTTSPPVADEKRVADELRMLYSTAVTEIAGFKQQQWHIANYGMLSYAAIVSISRLLNGVSPSERVVLSGVAVAVCIAGWKLIRMFHESIQVRRQRLTHMRQHSMTPQFVEAWRAGKEPGSMPDVPEERTQLEPLFRTVFALGLAAVLWLLWR